MLAGEISSGGISFAGVVGLEIVLFVSGSTQPEPPPAVAISVFLFARQTMSLVMETEAWALKWL